MAIFNFLPCACEEHKIVDMSAADFQYATIRPGLASEGGLYAWKKPNVGVFLTNTNVKSVEEFLEQTRNAAQDPSNKDAQGILSLEKLFGMKLGPAVPGSNLPNGIYFDNMEEKLAALHQKRKDSFKTAVSAKRSGDNETFNTQMQEYERLVSAFAIAEIAVEDIERTTQIVREQNIPKYPNFPY